MQIKLEQISIDDVEIIIRYNEMNDDLLHLISYLKSKNQTLMVFKDRTQLITLSPDDVDYIESIDDKTFICSKNEVYQMIMTLSELETKYEASGFFRINKSTIVNLYKIASLKSSPGGKIEVTLKTTEKLIVSRHYAPLLRQKLND